MPSLNVRLESLCNSSLCSNSFVHPTHSDPTPLAQSQRSEAHMLQKQIRLSLCRKYFIINFSLS